MATVAILKIPRPECTSWDGGSTFLWSLVKIGSSCSENLVREVHGEKKRKNNNNKKRCKNNKSPNEVWGFNKNNKIWYDLKDHNMAPKQRISIRNIIIYLETKFCPNRRIFVFWRPFWIQNGRHMLQHVLLPVNIHFHWNLFIFKFVYIGGHFENFKNKEHNFKWWSIFVSSFKWIGCTVSA